MRSSIVLLVALLLALSGCGGDDSTTDETTPAADGGDTNSAQNGSAGDELDPAELREGGKEILGPKGVTVTFEQGTAGWREFNGAKISRDTSEAASGKGSLLVETDGSSPFQGTETKQVPVKPDQTYAAVVDIRAEKGTALQLALRENDADAKELDARVTAFEATGDWQSVAVEKPFGPDGENALIQVRTADKPEKVSFNLDRPSLQATDGE